VDTSAARLFFDNGLIIYDVLRQKTPRKVSNLSGIFCLSGQRRVWIKEMKND